MIDNVPIVCAFPGTGKSYATEQFLKYGIKVSDSDSSNFDKSEFPQNYIKHLKEMRYKQTLTFASSHKVVREALLKEKVPFYVVVPDISLKDEYLKRYKQRGSNESFIKLISDNFETWINEIIDDGNKGLYSVVVLKNKEDTIFSKLSKYYIF
ncbi:hypothetical protein Pm5461_100 [Proteus phage vB_PmiM_Pm5461]|uniref:Uncharacterized protein n=1 Tax=Proteus phage vB_PmiM_Pm5461 TaxID=1636250 RepID=A0A0G2SSW0_9CAUD|nr:hypothetical protein AVT59_gp103 [Proteus phage vB_PmiM_Pm5461]AKA61965.1 hypothetical protein Pm5461_100 [Proteus phage vB_PmiM_Pm5461]